MEEVIVKGMPESLRRYIVDNCSIPATSFRIMPGNDLPEPAKRLLFHPNDMTSTLANYHGSPLYVDLIQKQEQDGVYFREVFLRTKKTDTVVEYGVIGIVLNSFTEEERRMILADSEPLGGLLHQFKIEFRSSPVCFFAISAECLVDTSFRDLVGHLYYGRFNQLTKVNGQTLAWIMEILPEETVSW